MWLQLLTRGRKNAVGRRCSTSQLQLFIQLDHMSCVIGRCDSVSGQKNSCERSLMRLAGLDWGGQTTPQYFVFPVCGQALCSLTAASSLMIWQTVKLVMYLGPLGECLFSFLYAEAEWYIVKAVDVYLLLTCCSVEVICIK